MQSTTATTELDRDAAIAKLEAVLERKIPVATFYRWLGPALILPKRAAGDTHYTPRDLMKLEFIGRYLAQERSLERAKQALINFLSTLEEA